MKAIGGQAARRASQRCVLLMTCLCLATACTSSAGGGGGSPQSSDSVASEGNSTTHGNGASALEGIWQTDDVSVADMVSALRRAGLQKWIQPFRAQGGMGASNVFRLTIVDGSWREEYSQNGGPFTDFDDATYEVQGNTVALTRGAGSYRWQVTGQELTLTFVAHSMSGSDEQSGIPGEVLQRAFYTAAPFHRRS